jgi:hypothetical protein
MLIVPSPECIEYHKIKADEESFENGANHIYL